MAQTKDEIISFPFYFLIFNHFQMCHAENYRCHITSVCLHHFFFPGEMLKVTLIILHLYLENSFQYANIEGKVFFFVLRVVMDSFYLIFLDKLTFADDDSKRKMFEQL